MEKKNPLKPKTTNNVPKIPVSIIYIGKFLQFFIPPLATKYAIRLFATPIRYKTPEREKMMAKSAKKEMVLIPNLKKEVMVYTYGYSKRKVLLIHGWSGRGTQLYKIADKLLENGFMTISFDAPAHGKSEGKYTMMTEFIAINKFLDNGDKLGLSKLAYNFLGGIMKLTQPLTAFFNPTINSYRRINAPPTKSGATWSPSSISYTGNNRTHMIRIPDPGRFELRLMDGSANPYLLQASVLAAGLDGLKNKIDPGKPLNCNMYEDHEKYPDLPKLPNELQQSLKMLKDNKDMNDAFEAGYDRGYESSPIAPHFSEYKNPDFDEWLKTNKKK